jgi:hypothetical protein
MNIFEEIDFNNDPWQILVPNVSVALANHQITDLHAAALLGKLLTLRPMPSILSSG